MWQAEWSFISHSVAQVKKPWGHSFFFFFFSGHALRLAEILVPRPGIEPRATAVKVPNPNHWTTRELPLEAFSTLLPCTAANHQQIVNSVFKTYLESDHFSPPLFLTYSKPSGLWLQHARSFCFCCGPPQWSILRTTARVVLCRSYKVPRDLASFLLCALFLTTALPFIHISLGTLASLFREHTKHTSASGPLHLLFPLPRMS